MLFRSIASGQTLARVYDATVEAPVTSEDAIANARIGPFKASQRCVEARMALHQKAFAAALDKVLNTPVSSTLARSEIVYAVRQVMTEFAGELPVRLLVYSDGWQNSREISFYANGKPRAIVADTELAAVNKLGFGAAERKPGKPVKALWFGLLANEDRKYYADALQVAEMQKFWRTLLMQWGANDVQIGTTLNNPKL